MKLRRGIAFFLLAVFLVADCGQVISLHTCAKSKHASYSIQPAKEECCGTGEDTEDHCDIKRSCCTVTSKYIKQSVAGNTQVQPLPVDEQANTFIASGVFELPALTTSSPSTFYQAFYRAAYSDNDCSLLQVFRC